MSLKIAIIIGTRPEVIKMAPIIEKIEKMREKFSLFILVTGQHKEMLEQALKLFEIKPNIDLKIMDKVKNLSEMTSLMLKEIDYHIKEFSPKIILVHGDTTTALCGSLCGFYNNIKIGHIEAGLRTNNLKSPFPEEMNRQVISRIATYHFVPTESAKKNLIKENIQKKRIIVTGNTVIDTLLQSKNKIENNPKLKKIIIKKLKDKNIKIKLNEKIILITAHRRENFGKVFEKILSGIKKIAIKNDKIKIIFPVHLNPNVQKMVKRHLKGVSNIFLIEPVDYYTFIFLMDTSYFIITDSGGIQEEAPSLGKPVLVIRNNTERPEAIKAGTVKLVGVDSQNLVNAVQQLIDDKDLYRKMELSHNPYGDGLASQKIVKHLLSI